LGAIKPNCLDAFKSLGAIKPKCLNRIAKIS
jgi:hypothetical protein